MSGAHLSFFLSASSPQLTEGISLSIPVPLLAYFFFGLLIRGVDFSFSFPLRAHDQNSLKRISGWCWVALPPLFRCRPWAVPRSALPVPPALLFSPSGVFAVFFPLFSPFCPPSSLSPPVLFFFFLPPFFFSLSPSSFLQKLVVYKLLCQDLFKQKSSTDRGHLYRLPVIVG